MFLTINYQTPGVTGRRLQGRWVICVLQSGGGVTGVGGVNKGHSIGDHLLAAVFQAYGSTLATLLVTAVGD